MCTELDSAAAGIRLENSYMLSHKSQAKTNLIKSARDPQSHPSKLLYIHQAKTTNHRPNCLFSNVLNSPKLTALNAKANSKPTSPPYAGSPILLPMGPMNHTCDMPITAPKTPKQKASTAAMPGGRRPGLFQMEMSYLRCLKTKCSVREMPS